MRLLFNYVFTVLQTSRLSQTILKNQYLSSFVNSSRTLSKNIVMAAKEPLCPAQDAEVFKGCLDRFEGVTVDSNQEKCAQSIFTKKLEDSLKNWTETGKRGIWFKVHLDQASWVPILAENGFKFHHANENFVMMYKWISKLDPCNIPPFAHTMLGVGAVVVNDQNQILVVREKFWKHPHWKLPGGYVEPGENLVDAAIREVLEETNIETEFQTVLTLRQAHGGMFNCSDIYTVISLKPLTQTISKCEKELAEAKWMDLNEYLEHPHVHELNRFFVEKYMDYCKLNVKMDWHHGVHQILKKPYTVYFVTTDKEEKPGD